MKSKTKKDRQDAFRQWAETVGPPPSTLLAARPVVDVVPRALLTLDRESPLSVESGVISPVEVFTTSVVHCESETLRAAHLLVGAVGGHQEARVERVARLLQRLQVVGAEHDASHKKAIA